MAIAPGAIVRTSDGQVIGQIKHLIFASAAGGPTAARLARTPETEPDLLVPLESLAEESDGGVTLTDARFEPGSYQHFDERAYAAPPEAETLPEGYSRAGILVPSSGYVPTPAPSAPGGHMAAPVAGPEQGKD